MHWVKQNQVKVFVSEFGSGLTNSINPSQDNCTKDVNYFLDQVRANMNMDKGGFIGWTAWVGGHGWSINDMNNLAPNPNPPSNGKETLQMQYIYKPQISKLH